jgi:hypothetical protein
MPERRMEKEERMNNGTNDLSTYFFGKGRQDALEGKPLQHYGRSYMAGYEQGLRELRQKSHSQR